MKVGINLRYLQRTITGIERATIEVINALVKLEDDLTLMGYITNRAFADLEIENTLFNCHKLEIKKSTLFHEDIGSRLYWDMVQLGKKVSCDNVDLFWGPSFSIPISIKCPSIVTIHDLAYEYFPRAYTPAMRLWLKIIPKISVLKSTRILTISENSKKDIIKFLNVESDRIDVVSWACNANFRFMPENKNVFQKILNYYGINAPYILTVSQISPRKNLDTLINAFALLKKNPSFLHKLVIVGNNGWLYSSIYEIVKREGLANEVIFTGVIPDNDLIAIYNMADLFIFPSLYEGFGLPVLEAMSCGLPVICSNTSSLPEVVGNAGILFPPKDIYSLVNAVLGLLENPWLYKDLRERGLIKASEYSWEFTAKQIIKIFYDLRKYNHTATRH